MPLTPRFHALSLGMSLALVASAQPGYAQSPTSEKPQPINGTSQDAASLKQQGDAWVARQDEAGFQQGLAYYDHAILTGSKSAQTAKGLALARRSQLPSISPEQRDEFGRQASILLQAAARAGDPEAAWQLGSLHVIGAGLPRSQDQALAWIGQAARANHPAAGYWMARHFAAIHSQGRDPIFWKSATPDEIAGAQTQYFQYLTHAAVGGHVISMDELARLYGIKDLWPEAASFWSNTAQIHRGHLFPVANVPDWVLATGPSALHHNPIGVGQAGESLPVTEHPSASLTRAQERLAQAEQRIAALEAQFYGDQQPASNVHQLTQASDQDFAQVPDRARDLNRLGLDVYEGGNYPMAVGLFDQAIQAGSIAAKANLGLMVLRGEGIKRHPRRAIKLLTAAAQAGNTVAAENLGYINANGLTGKVDIRKAIHWYEHAMIHGSPTARAALLSLVPSRP